MATGDTGDTRGIRDREVTRDPQGHKRHTGYIRHR